MHGSNLWTFADDALATGADVCLVTMVDAVGSGPNRPGSRLVVTADGNRAGTVGGGASEFTLVNTARELLTAAPRPGACVVTMEHRDGENDRVSGMICSGTQVFALACLTPADRATVQRIAKACDTGSPVRIRLSIEGLSVSDVSQPVRPSSSFDPDAWCYEETVGVVDTATLVGGGHVSLALSPLLVTLGMRVVVLDNRANLSTMASNALAHECRVIDYACVEKHIPTGDRSYVCIMTFGHRHDEQVLERLVSRPLRYLGMMGSAAKISQIRERLLSHGVAREALNAVYAPIGLPIGSNTPEEIAISIAAQIIVVRHGPRAVDPHTSPGTSL